MSTKFLLAAIGSAALLLTAACSGAEPTHEHTTTSESVTAEFNDSDVTFLQTMYPHHEQAIQMADLAEGRSQTFEITSLATDITAAQQSEMSMIAQWLSNWGRPAPDEADMDHEHGGMMSDEQIASLEASSGTDFDRQWLTLMIEHHAGAIDSASTEIEHGANPDAKALAKSIVETQQQEIDTMRGLLD